MTDWHFDRMDFKGTFEADGQELAVTFSVGINSTGEADILIEPSILDRNSFFLLKFHQTQRTAYNETVLRGTSENGETFVSHDVVMYNLLNCISAMGVPTIQPIVMCVTGEITTEQIQNPPPTPKYTYLLQGFFSATELIASTPLGKVEMAGTPKTGDSSEISGHITITADEPPRDFLRWGKEIEQFTRHLRSMMSFANGARLMVPIVEIIDNGRYRINVRSQARSIRGSTPPFSPYNLTEIFDCAIKSYFYPRPYAEHLPAAIDWFNMNHDYREGKLIGAMTVLENLVNSNLSRRDLLLRPPAQFKKMKTDLLKVVQTWINEWTPDPQQQAVEFDAIKDKFEDLNRCTLKQKIDLLAKRWGVKLDDIPTDAIGAAKKARDHVVHTGIFTLKENSEADLMDHVRLTRELVVRFILTALEFKGKYISYLHGQMEKEFIMGIPESS